MHLCPEERPKPALEPARRETIVGYGQGRDRPARRACVERALRGNERDEFVRFGRRPSDFASARQYRLERTAIFSTIRPDRITGCSQMPSRSPEPTLAEVLAWMRAIPSPSWRASVRDVEYAISEIKEEARREDRRLASKAARARKAGPSSDARV